MTVMTDWEKGEKGEKARGRDQAKNASRPPSNAFHSRKRY